MLINRKTKVITYAVLSMFFAFTLVLSIAEAYTSVKMWGSDGQFQFPLGIAVDSSGNVYVADYGHSRIQKFDSNGNFITTWGSSCYTPTGQLCVDPDGQGPLEKGDGQFLFPTGIAVDSSDNVYVAETGNDRIQRFDSNGNFITKWGSGGTFAGQFLHPFGIAVDSSGNVYVADTYNHRIQKFTGNELFPIWGTQGNGDGQFSYPEGIAVDSSGNVYVADSGNSRIQKFDSDGNFITKWGSFCTTDTGQLCVDPDGQGPLEISEGQFFFPTGIAVDSSDNVYVADTYNHRIQKFTSDGNYITHWGSNGTFAGQFLHPIGIAVDSSGNVYVSDHRNSRVQVFAPTIDNDNDGIANEVDYSLVNGEYVNASNTTSNDFTDTVTGGTTFGTITSRGNQSLTISEYQNPQGVLITTTGGSQTPKTNITVCDGAGQYSLGPGANFISTCDSVHTSVLAGSTLVIVLLTAEDGSQSIAYLDAGDDLLFDTTTSTFTAISSNTVFTLTSIDGQKQAIISLSAQNSVTISATDFSFSAPSTNTSPVSIIIPTSIILNPGDIFTPIVPFTIQGFYPPVDMPSTQGVVNTIKDGSTVPLKFNVYDPNKNNQEITDVSVVKDIKATLLNTITTSSGSQISCGSAPVDDVELTTTGATNLRYDTVAKQFVMNLQLPKGQSGNCMQITLTLTDNTSIGAYFRIK